MEVDEVSTVEYFPYTSQTSIDLIIALARSGQLPDKITPLKLAECGIPEGSTHRTLHALKFFGLIDSESYPTELLFHLAQTSPYEYAQELAKLVKVSYAPIFSRIPEPSQASAEQLAEAFSHAYPPKQHRRMIALFRSLCCQSHLMSNNVATTRKQKRTNALFMDLVK